MDVVERIDTFFRESRQEIFIEAEGRPSNILKFVNDYNNRYQENLRMEDNGLIVLQDNANKWGLELRLYFNDKSGMPDEVQVTRNSAYRSEYGFRINDVKIIKELFERGYRIGLNDCF
ncbi:MAG: hypothetical protein HFG30_08310 [Eubacterium sp.]|jgi:hypothetical protein|nr:hypothetical protein [Eubacterium sp.]